MPDSGPKKRLYHLGTPQSITSTSFFCTREHRRGLGCADYLRLSSHRGINWRGNYNIDISANPMSSRRTAHSTTFPAYACVMTYSGLPEPEEERKHSWSVSHRWGQRNRQPSAHVLRHAKGERRAGASQALPSEPHLQLLKKLKNSSSSVTLAPSRA